MINSGSKIFYYIKQITRKIRTSLLDTINMCRLVKRLEWIVNDNLPGHQKHIKMCKTESTFINTLKLDYKIIEEIVKTVSER